MPFSARPGDAPSSCSPPLARIAATWTVVRRASAQTRQSLTLFTGWAWIAAGSLVGFEMLDIIFGTAVLVPELLPLVILTLALAWFCRQRVRRGWSRLRARVRLHRLRS
ncbi:MAG: hypothetical protein FWD85_02990 [Microbacteriaceae bacterium]|nr:hypothetical protein [Microbacteriaceae bacterium]